MSAKKNVQSSGLGTVGQVLIILVIGLALALAQRWVFKGPLNPFETYDIRRVNAKLMKKVVVSLPPFEYIAAEKLQSLLTNDLAVILDGRSPGDYANGHLAGAVNIGMLSPGQFLPQLNTYLSGGKVPVVCPARPGDAKADIWVKELIKRKIFPLFVLQGDIAAWSGQGLAIETGGRVK
jgi:rhodanese-related sulfurtransferase